MFSAHSLLEINSSPFVEIYIFKGKEEWSKYCVQNTGESFSIGSTLQQEVYQYAFYLPVDVVDKFYGFSSLCISFVPISYHFDQALIVKLILGLLSSAPGVPRLVDPLVMAVNANLNSPIQFASIAHYNICD